MATGQAKMKKAVVREATSLFFLYNQHSTRVVDHYYSRAQAERSLARAERRVQVVCLWHTFSSKVGRKG